MHSKETSKPSLPSTSKDLPANVKAEGCSNLDILEDDSSQPNYPVRTPQTMPRQEKSRTV
jgi:hypothetical protein